MRRRHQRSRRRRPASQDQPRWPAGPRAPRRFPSPAVTVRWRLAIAPSGSFSKRSVRSWRRRTIWVGSLMSPVEITLVVNSRCTTRGSVRSTCTGVAQAASSNNKNVADVLTAPAIRSQLAGNRCHANLAVLVSWDRCNYCRSARQPSKLWRSASSFRAPRSPITISRVHGCRSPHSRDNLMSTRLPTTCRMTQRSGVSVV